VAGKGVSAALLMARLSAAVRFCLATEPTVSQAVRRVNADLMRPGNVDRHVTFVTGVIDLSQWTMPLVNAGHMPPLRRQASGEIDEVGTSCVDIPLGVFERPYKEAEVALEPGDVLLFYTDGVTEARNSANAMYGSDRLREAVRRASPGAEAVGKAVLADVRKFAGDRLPSDDLAIICLSREG
jgi:serine phosphatase RsbU (regulator of sigma subunit)